MVGQLKAAEAGLPLLKADIAQLTQWIFGAKDPRELWPELTQEETEKLEQVNTLGKIFLDEVV